MDVMPGTEDSYVAYCMPWANVSNTPFREYKSYVHEGGISTPLIAHWPKGITKTDGWETTPTHLVDIMATAVDLAGAAYPQEVGDRKITPMEGISLKPAFNDGQLKRDRPLFWEHEGNRAVRDGKWKLVAKGVKGKWELYNMENDRGEMNDLAEGKLTLVKKMATAYKDWAGRSQVVPFGSWKRKGGR